LTRILAAGLIPAAGQVYPQDKNRAGFQHKPFRYNNNPDKLMAFSTGFQHSLQNEVRSQRAGLSVLHRLLRFIPWALPQERSNKKCKG